MFPVRQEVSSASCHSPLSCGHFLVFCQYGCAVLTVNGGGDPHGELGNNGEKATVCARMCILVNIYYDYSLQRRFPLLLTVY